MVSMLALIVVELRAHISSWHIWVQPSLHTWFWKIDSAVFGAAIDE